jgi:AraC-like DNA-binding protein
MLDKSAQADQYWAMKKPQKISTSIDISMTYLKHLLRMAVRWGISEQLLLDGSGLTPANVEELDARISTRQAGQITRRLMVLSGRSDIGMEYGFMIRPTSHGFLGYAVMSCATLGEAMRVLDKYFSLHLKDYTQVLEIKDEEVILTLDESHNLGPMRQVSFEAMLVSCCLHLNYLTGRELPDLKVLVDWPRPDYFDTYQDRLPRWEFKQARIQVCFPREYLSLPLVMADPNAVKHALAQLEMETATRSLMDAPDIVPRVRALLVQGPEGYPSLGDVAARLFFSESTLKRKLSDVGSSFQVLLDEARQRRAIELIREGQLSLQQIAQLLGYTDPAAFTRAFKRWTGERPSDLRKEQ